MPYRPNLVLITTDQQRWDALGAAGNDAIHTPNMDRLAREGTLFEHAFCAAPLSVPTRASLVTGHCWMNRQHFDGHVVRDPGNTLPARLGKAGYVTQAIGKMHFAPENHRKLNGFHDALLSEETRWVRRARSAADVRLDDYDQYLARHGLWGWDKPQEIGYNQIKPLINHMPKEHHVTQWCGDQTLRWLADAPREPFFLWSSFVKPHVPYDAPAHLADFYDPARIPPPVRRDGELEAYPMYRDLRRAREWDLYSDEAVRRARANYYANVTFIDEQIGRILDLLERTGQADHTIVAFTSDHGDMLGDHGLWYKSLGFDGSVRVPMILWSPRLIDAGRRIDAPVSHYDLTRTLLDIGGADDDLADYPGTSLRRIAAGEVQRDMVISALRGYYVCHRDWKYNFYPAGGYEELFDRRRDPDELHNIAQRSTSRAVCAQLKRELEAWLQRYGQGTGLDDSGRLACATYVPPSPRPERNPHSRLPWESRIPPQALGDEGPTLSWWWAEHGPDLLSMLPRECWRGIGRQRWGEKEHG